MSQPGFTAEEQFCQTLKHLILWPPSLAKIEAGHRQGQSQGMVVFQLLPLYIPFGSLDVDRFATHLVQLTGNQLKIRQGNYWMGEFMGPHEALVVLTCSGNRPVNLAKLLDIIRKSSASFWLKQNAGKLIMMMVQRYTAL